MILRSEAQTMTLKDEPPRVFTLRQTIRIQNASPDLVQSVHSFGMYRFLTSLWPDAELLSYNEAVLAGAKSLEIETTDRLQINLGDRHGQMYHPGMFLDRTLNLQSCFNNFSASCSADVPWNWQGYDEAFDNFGQESYWGSDYAGIGHQFANGELERVW
jgi:hypothetical protein